MDDIDDDAEPLITHAPGVDWDPAERRARMVERDIVSRGVRHAGVLRAIGTVPRERFVAPDVAEFAYDDHPLPIAGGQTISQPYIVALMAEAAELTPGDRVLEVGAGSGYGAAVLSLIAEQVWAIERHRELVSSAERVLRELGYDNARVIWGDGTLGFPPAAPFDAIVVTAGGPRVPPALLDQLADGGRLVMPIGSVTRNQELVRLRRDGDTFEEESLGPVRFVPLIGAQGYSERVAEPEAEVLTVAAPMSGRRTAGVRAPHGISALVAESAEPFSSIVSADIGPLIERIGDARVVLLGESTHGTSEFYRLRARITEELIAHHGFTVVAVESDWPDAARVDAWIRRRTPIGPPFTPFARFPTWMWRNRETVELVDWLRDYNEAHEGDRPPVRFCGLDLYSLFTSRDEVLAFLDSVDTDAAEVARTRYGCLTPWEQDPAAYGRAVVSEGLVACEPGVVATLTDLLANRMDYVDGDVHAFDDAAHNALVVANAERYYRTMYYGSVESWNLRDQHMFDTLRAIEQRAAGGVIVWEHNSHIGDGSATEMASRGESNVGQLCREAYGDDAYLVGFGTDRGTVAAASTWGGPMEVKSIRHSHSLSYERVFVDSGIPAFFMHLRDPERRELRSELSTPRLERAIGVIYRPETELQSHYFQAVLPRQFDEYVWLVETSAVVPLPTHGVLGAPDLYPFGL